MELACRITNVQGPEGQRLTSRKTDRFLRAFRLNYVSHKRILPLLLPNRRFGTMTRKQTRLIGQGKYLGPDALDQLPPVRARQVGTADGASKDQVAAETRLG